VHRLYDIQGSIIKAAMKAKQLMRGL